MKMQQTIEIPDERIADIITGAVEGGIGYWARTMDYEWDCDPKDTYAVVVEFESAMDTLGLGAPSLTEQFFGANYYEELDALYEDHGSDVLNPWIHRVDFQRMADTVARALVGDFGKNGTFYIQQIIDEEDDAQTYDVLFQLACFGELVYG